MSKLKPVLEQFRDALPADGENATVYDRYVLKENFYSLLNTISETGTFPEYTAFYHEQWNYVLGSTFSTTKDKWETNTCMRDKIAPVRSEPCKSRDEKALYDKATWLSNLLAPKSNATIVALNKEIAGLLASDRFHEICVTKKNETSNQLLQKSKTMRNLAICVTLKAILLNEQTMLESTGLLTQLTEKQDLAQIKSILNDNSSFKAAYKHLNNQGMYDFIMKDGYRKLSKQVVPGIYTSMKNLIKKYNLETPKDQHKIFENEADRTNEKAPKASKKITNKLP